jgi:hypothetical protein
MGEWLAIVPWIAVLAGSSRLGVLRLFSYGAADWFCILLPSLLFSFVF